MRLPIQEHYRCPLFVNIKPLDIGELKLLVDIDIGELNVQVSIEPNH